MIKNIASLSRIANRVKTTLTTPISYSQSSLVQRFLDHRYSRLCRYEKPVGCMLLYWPTTWGLAIGAATLPCTP